MSSSPRSNSSAPLQPNKKILETQIPFNVIYDNYMKQIEERTQIQRKYIPNVDIYSLGVMLYGLLFANRSFGKKWDNKSIPTKEDVMNVIQDKLDEINNDKYITNKCKDFFNKVLLQDITKRKNVYDLLEHPWINDNNEEFDICLLVNDDFSKKLIIESIKCGVVKRQIESCKSKSKLKNSKYNEHGFKRRKGCAKIKANFNPKVA
jgi:serine/threonine protein kinase